MARIGSLDSNLDVTSVATQWTGSEYMRYGIDQTTTSVSGQPAQGVLRFLPFFIPDSITATKIGIEVSTSGTGSSVARLGIYADLDSAPDTLILDAGTVDITTTGYKEITISEGLDFGMIWVAVVPQTISGNPRFVQSDQLSVPMRMASADISGTRWCFEETGVTGALPATASATLTTNRAPIAILYRA